MFVYSLKSPSKYKDKTKRLHHSIFISEKKVLLVPNQIDSKCINPESFHKLKTIFKIKKILIEDRVRGV